MSTANPLQRPTGEYQVTIDGILVPDTATVMPDHKVYKARVQTLCGGHFYNLEGTPDKSMTAAEYARRAQIEASIAHVTRVGCAKCEDCFQRAVNVSERRLIHGRDYTLGEIKGLITSGDISKLVS